MLVRYFAFLLSVLPLPGAAAAADAPKPSPKDWIGLWQAELAFGPEARGALLIRDGELGWQAEIAGFTAPVTVNGASLTFTLPDDHGSFRGTRVGDGEIRGVWTQPPTVQGGGQRYASPVLLRQVSPGNWLGTLRPLNDHLSFYLPVSAGEGDTVTAWLMNPERNLGKFLDVTRLERTEDDSVKLIGKPFNAKAEKVISTGDWDGTDQKLRIFIPWHGDYYAMTRADSLTDSPFYARGKNPAPYKYRAPPVLPDGWPVADASTVGLTQAGLEHLVQFLIDIPLTDVHASQVHAVLVARHGKLVLEEYFHGFHRDLPHETRSAAKSYTATLVGAAMQSGAPVKLDTPVYSAIYKTMYGGKLPKGLEKRKRALTVQHLLTQSTGLDCDDSDNNSAGNEDKIQQESKEPDWWKLTLALKTVRDPGEKAVYCSMQPNLLGGVLKATTGEPLPELFDRLVARPLGMTRYHLPLTPTGDAYMGGGAHILPRDFMKFGQLMLDGGVWQGHRVLSQEFVADAIKPRYDMSGIQYGYLWWSIEFPHPDGKPDHKVRAFFAGGNGGQMVMGIPELDLVVAFLGGNYSDKGTFRAQREFVPQLLLPAVIETSSKGVP